MSLKVGLTGGIASGKTTVTKLFSALGVEIIDADLIARELVTLNSPCFKQIISYFGTEIMQADGNLNRAKLRELIFSDTDAKNMLESILHPAVREELTQQADQAKGPYCILSVPLLLEAHMADLVDRILVIDVSESSQLNRLKQRDNLTPSEAMAMIKSQIPREQRLSMADDVINNEVSLAQLNNIVNSYHQKYLKIAAQQ